MGRSLLDFDNIDFSTPGVAWLFENANSYVSQGEAVFARRNEGGNTTSINTAYTESGNTYYVTFLAVALVSGGIYQLFLYLHTNSTPFSNNILGFQPGQNLSDDAEQNLAVAFEKNGHTYKYRFSDDPDTAEPYQYLNLGADAQAAYNAFAATSPAVGKAILFDATHANIDFNTLTYTTDPTIAVTASTTPVAPGNQQTISGTFDDGGDGDAITVSASATLGTLGTVSQNNNNNTWSVAWTAPAGTPVDQSAVITITATDVDSNTGTATATIVTRGLPHAPAAPTVSLCRHDQHYSSLERCDVGQTGNGI